MTMIESRRAEADDGMGQGYDAAFLASCVLERSAASGDSGDVPAMASMALVTMVGPTTPARVPATAIPEPRPNPKVALPAPYACLRCHREREGSVYDFQVRPVRDQSAQQTHAEGGFICHQCAEKHLGLNPWTLWANVLFIGTFGFVAAAVLFLARWLFTSIAVAIFTIRAAARQGELMRYRRARVYLGDRQARQRVTKLAMDLRRKAILKDLDVSAGAVKFVAV